MVTLINIVSILFCKSSSVAIGVARLFRTISLGRLPTAADGTDDQNIFSLIVTLTKSFVESLNHFRSKANLNLPLLSKRTSYDSPVNL